MSTQFFTADDGAKIAYQDEGEGLPVLCLAGLTRNMADFDYVAPYLSGVRLIRMDYRGRGQSDYTGAAPILSCVRGAMCAVAGSSGGAEGVGAGTSRVG